MRFTINKTDTHLCPRGANIILRRDTRGREYMVDGDKWQGGTGRVSEVLRF